MSQNNYSNAKERKIVCGSRAESLAFNKACYESKEKKELQLLILSLYSLTSLIYLGEEGNRRQVEGKLSPEGVDYVIRDTLKYLATKLFASLFSTENK